MTQQPQPEYAQMPLTDEMCEQAVIGTLLSTQAAAALNATRELLSEDCFYYPKHRELYKAIHTIDSAGGNVDVISVFEELRKHPPAVPIEVYEITALTEQSTSTVVIADYAARLADLSKRRRFELVAAKFRQAAHDEATDIDTLLTTAREDIESLLTVGASQSTTMADSIKAVRKLVADNRAGVRSVGTRTGFRQLDKFGGFHGTDLVIIAGDTSMGKTSVALSMARNMVMDGNAVAYYSMEMQHYQLTARILAMQSGVTSSAILYKPLPDGDAQRLEAATRQLIDKNLYYDDKSLLSLDTIMASIRSMKLKYGIRGAFVDYLQIIDLNEKKGASKEQAMADAARKLKNLAKSIDIWIVALSQLSRRNSRLDPDPMPTMDRLRGSGQIAEASDTVILVYRPEYYGADIKFPKPFRDEDTHNKAMLMVTKGRNVGVGRFVCNFIPELTLFTEQDVGDLPVISKGETNGDNTDTNEYGDALPF